MTYELQNKVALVTGGASGIGLEVVKLLAVNGASVMLADIDDKAGMAVANDMAAQGYSVKFHSVDVTDAKECEAMMSDCVDVFGKLNIAVNNAGIIGEMKPLADHTIDSWHRTLNVNLDSVFYCMKYQIPRILETGNGSIVNLSSICGKIGAPGLSPYTASKHGVEGLTKVAALEYATQGIRINSVGPAVIDTPLIHRDAVSQDPEEIERQLAMHPMGRFGKPQEVAELILWLCSDKASYATGGYYPINGGYLAH